MTDHRGKGEKVNSTKLNHQLIGYLERPVVACQNVRARNVAPEGGVYCKRELDTSNLPQGCIMIGVLDEKGWNCGLDVVEEWREKEAG